MEEELKITMNTQKLHKLFGKSMYASKYAWISEMCQNAVDSHRMAGVKEPVVIGIKYDPKDKNRQIFYVKDEGLSFADENDFRAKIGTIGDSGKDAEKTNDENCAMGKHGIGSLSVSAYQPEWRYTIVTPAQEKLSVTMRDKEGMGIRMEIKNLGKTEEKKGVLFEVDVAYLGIPQLIQNMKSKLAYFKDIMFEFPEDLIRGYKELLTLNSTFQIFQSDDFQISTLSNELNLHVALDQYSYPINWTMMKMPPIPLNVGLKFGMADGLSPDSTRENLQLDDDYSNVIMAKIKKVSTWFVERYNSEFPDEFTSIKAMLEKMGKPAQIKLGNAFYDVMPFAAFSSVPMKKCKFKDVEDEVFNRFMSRTQNGADCFVARYEITMNGAKRSQPSYYKRFSSKVFVDKAISTRTMDYLKQQYKGCGLYYRGNIPLLHSAKRMKSWENIMNLDRVSMKKEYKKTGVSIWRKKLDQVCLLEKAYIKDYFITASEIKVPADFNKTPAKAPNRKEKICLDDLSGEVGIKYTVNMDKYSSDFASKFAEKVVKVKDLAALSELHIYGFESQREQLDLVYRMYSGGSDLIKACAIGVKNQPYIEKLKLTNFMKVEEFLAGKHDLFRKLITAYMIEKELRLPFTDTFNHIKVVDKYVSKEIAEDMQKVLKYLAAHGAYGNSNISKEAMDPLVALTNDLKLHDKDIWETFQKLKKVMNQLDYVNYMADGLHMDDKNSYFDNERKMAIRMTKDITKMRQIEMDWQEYKLDTDGQK